MYALLLLVVLAAPPESPSQQPGGSSSGSSSGSTTAAVKVRGHATVKQRMAAGGVVLRIQSPGGIGHIEIDRKGEGWPANVTLEIDLKELEGVTARTAALSIQSGRKHAEIGEVFDFAAKKTTLSKKPENRFKIERVTIDNKLHIVIQLPPVLLLSSAKSIKIQGVDYYR